MFNCQLLRKIRCVSSNLIQLKRQAGHSKWANIRHTKAAKDGEKNQLTLRKLNEIKVVCAENGWVTDPDKSPSLAKAVEAAIRANVPKETVQNFVKKLQSSKEKPLEFRLRGPNECILIVTFSCSTVGESDLRGKFKRILKNSSVLATTLGFNQAFEKKGVIVAQLSQATMDDAEEAAIVGGAEEVRPEDEAEHSYRFMTEPESLWQVSGYLTDNKWNVLEANVELHPTYLVELSESELQEVTECVEKMQELPEFIKIVDNIA